MFNKETQQNILGGFIASRDKFPNNIALFTNRIYYTYSELDEIARTWCSGLLNITNFQPRRVGIIASRNITSYASVLTILYSGATFVPMSRKFGPDRIAYIINETKLEAIFVDEESLPCLEEALHLVKHCPVVLCPSLNQNKLNRLSISRVFGKEDLETVGIVEPNLSMTSNDEAYILFTSGSTGVPKGVPILHKNVESFLRINQQRYKLSDKDSLSQTFDQTFDLSIFDLFMAWQSGAKVSSFQPIQLISPLKFIKDQNITVWFSVPSIAILMMKKGLLTPGIFESLRWSLFCGEPLFRKTAEAWQAAAPNSILENLYGPTELTISCAAYRWDKQYSPKQCTNDIVPIGTLYEGHKAILIVDGELQPLNDGLSGELCVCGPQTFEGYLNNDEKTKQSFVWLENEKFYRTGDIVKSVDGQLMFLGRKDSQVKIMGHRIELGDIESKLLQIEGVHEVAVITCPINQDLENLVACVTGNNIDQSKILNNLQKKLPLYMLPKEVYVLDGLPRNHNGKVDFKEIHKIVIDKRNGGVHV